MAAPATTATSAGNAPPPQVPLGGPVFIALRVLGYAIVLGAAAIVVDSLRRPRSHFGGSNAQRWMWAAPQAALLAVLALVWVVRPLAETLSGFIAVYLLFAPILQIAYLLVVVFPRRREPIPPEVEKELPHE